jgi:glycosyltransferase involved in cell wall biosynthesis
VKRILVVSSFVEPSLGGVEQFVTWVQQTLRSQRYQVRVLAGDGSGFRADAKIPMQWLTASRWPLPTGGWSILRDEIRNSDFVLINSHRHLLSVIAAVVAWQQHVPARLVIHRAGEIASQSRVHDSLGAIFDTVLTPIALRAAPPVSVSQIGVEYVERMWRCSCTFLPYPARADNLEHLEHYNGVEPLRVVWAARMVADKGPLLAVDVCQRLSQYRAVHLDMYGDGPMAVDVAQAVAGMPQEMITLHGQQPWATVIDAQCRAHVCLSTSLIDNVQLAILEPLARGIPCVSTAVGDAPRYYSSELSQYCLLPAMPHRLAQSIDELAGNYIRAKMLFADNGIRLQTLHSHGCPEKALTELIESATES